MSHTTCWIRQNLRMSDRVSLPKTPPDTLRQCCKENWSLKFIICMHVQSILSLSSPRAAGIAGRVGLQPTRTRTWVYFNKRISHKIVFFTNIMFMFLCVCPCPDINISHAKCKYGLTRVENRGM